MTFFDRAKVELKDDLNDIGQIATYKCMDGFEFVGKNL